MMQREQYAKGGIGRWFWDYRDEKVIKEIGDSQRILDVGCGEGITLEKIVKRFPGREIMGIDNKFSQDFGLPIGWGTVYSLPYPDESFDCVLLLEVIEHLSRPEKALYEIARILKPYGKLIVLFPNDRNFFLARMLCGKFDEALADSGHLSKWDARRLEGCLPWADLKIDKVAYLPMRIFWLNCMVVARKI